ncbi:hypothetical protein ACFQ4C_00065 [Larkinella insperata]|uniref:Uncharacterized protein n=1 Tax=Larkinella insperata TaxID=332158 RepID=A0ABW3Q071_9BACT|nr:hypothetical protein [Larkinella insperata]
MYILIQNPNTDNPEIVLDSTGLLQWFTTEDEAYEYASAHQLQDYEIFRLTRE